MCNKEDDGSDNEQNQGTGIKINLLVFFLISILTSCEMKVSIDAHCHCTRFEC